MKAGNVKLLIVFLGLVTATSLFSQNMLVGICGSPEVSGVYVEAGIYDEVSYYQKGSYYLYREVGMYWIIGTQLGDILETTTYYVEESTNATPVGLTIDDYYFLGIAPGPTIEDSSLPVGLSSFSARSAGESVVLEWATESEVDNLGFILERSEDGMTWTTIASYQTHRGLEGAGSTSSRTEYAFTDPNVEPGREYYYRLSDVNTQGEVGLHPPIHVAIPMPGVPEGASVMENAYPNPFNPQTYVPYHLNESSNVNIAVYDLYGRKVRTLFTGPQTAGSYQVYWHGNDEAGIRVPSGSYLIRLEAGEISEVQKVTMVK